ncbi:MAG: FadR family transcriptional regulator [Chloroflexi bacterium]|nr:FadR family transcriptional regulator [Chloroflexota bacterium]
MYDLEPLKTVNVTETVQQRLIDFIRIRGMKAGQKLPSENQLAEALGVSRIALREGLQSLQALSILQSKAGSGWYVRDISFDSVSKILIHILALNNETFADLEEIRVNLECSFIDVAIRTLQPEDLEILEQAVAEIEALAQAGESYLEPDRVFHLTLFSRVPNRILIELMNVFWTLFDFGFSADRIPPLEIHVAQASGHRQVLEALRTGDVQAANKRLRENISYFNPHNSEN